LFSRSFAVWTVKAMRLPSGEIAGELTVVNLYQSLNVNARPTRAFCATAATTGSRNAVVAR
jgi:hypothetical protein